jgi:hypothetical protein
VKIYSRITLKDWASNNSFCLRMQCKKPALTSENRSTVCTHRNIFNKHMHQSYQIVCQRLNHFDDNRFWEIFYWNQRWLNIRFLMRTIDSQLFSLSLTFVLRYVGSGYTDVVFRLSLYLLGLKLSLYLVRILYFVVISILIRLHQSKQAYSTTWQALLNCKYQILSIYPCCSLQNMNIVLILKPCMI